MTLTAKNWKNKEGTSTRSCKCGSWKNHWINGTKKTFPKTCSVSGCTESATLGAHMINSNEEGEWIVPACSSCNNITDEFNLKGGITLYPANKSKTCDT